MGLFGAFVMIVFANCTGPSSSEIFHNLFIYLWVNSPLHLNRTVVCTEHYLVYFNRTGCGRNYYVARYRHRADWLQRDNKYAELSGNDTRCTLFAAHKIHNRSKNNVVNLSNNHSMALNWACGMCSFFSFALSDNLRLSLSSPFSNFIYLLVVYLLTCSMT